MNNETIAPYHPEEHQTRSHHSPSMCKRMNYCLNDSRHNTLSAVGQTILSLSNKSYSNDAERRCHCTKPGK